jgi:hypothetical protein
MGRGSVFKRRLPLYVERKDWSDVKGKTKGKTADQKQIDLILNKLNGTILLELNNAHQVGLNIESGWLANLIEDYFGQHTAEEDDVTKTFLVDFSANYINGLEQTVDTKGNGRVRLETLKKYRTTLKKLIEFEVFLKRKIKFSEMDKNLLKDFMCFLEEERRLSPNTIGRDIRFVAGFARVAISEGVEVHSELSFWKGFTEKGSFVTLNENELQLLLDLETLNDHLNSARDWLLIACYTGQRVSDFLRFEKSMIIKVKDIEDGKRRSFISVTQEKTKKDIMIPIHPHVEAILNKRGGDFPPLPYPKMASSKTRLNEQIKQVAKLAGFNGKFKGRKRNGAEEDRKSQVGLFEKWELVSTHIGRRSFATNFYGVYPTPVVMAVTGHSTEKQFLEYIGLTKGNESAMVMAREFAKMKN